MRSFIHDPDEFLDYGFEWELEDDEEITASTWEHADGFLTLSDDAFDVDTGLTLVWVAIVEDTPIRTKAILTNHITTNQGRQRDRSIQLFITSR